MSINQVGIDSKLSLICYNNPNVYRVVALCQDSQNSYYELICEKFNQRELIGFDIECFSYDQTFFIKDTDLHLFKMV